MHNHSDHEVLPDDDAPLTYYQKLEIAVRELLIRPLAKVIAEVL